MHWLSRSFLAVVLLVPPISLATEVLGWPSRLSSGICPECGAAVTAGKPAGQG